MNLKELFTKKIGIRIVDLARRTTTCKILDELFETEYCNIDELEAIQFQRLKELLVHCKKHVPYYRQLFSEYKFDPEVILSPSDMECLPVLTKDDIRNNFSRLKADNIMQFRPKLRGTGGSTGEPLKLYHDARSHGTMWANMYRGFGYGGYRLGERYVTLAYGSLRPRKLRFGMPLYFWFQNTVTFPSYHIEKENLDEIFRFFHKEKPKYLFGYASVILQLARFLMSKKRFIDGLRAIFTTSDMLFPDQRKLIEKHLGAPVYDNYGCPEAGVLTNECDQHDGYHYNMETCHIDIADKDENGVGRIISTNLSNYAFPIVRYDTGDIGQLGRTGMCPCGRSHSKIRRLMGRQRDIITLPDGHMLHGAFFNHLPEFYQDDRITRYQIIQPAADKLEIHLALADRAKISDFDHIVKSLEENFKNQVSISLEEGNFRESSISRKHRTVISDVDNIWTVSS